MLPQRPTTPRYLRSVRAAQLARLVAAGAIVTGTAACGSGDDAEVFGAAADTSADGTTSAVAVSTAAAPATAPVATAPETPTADPAASASAAAGATFPADGELVVDFTYAPEASDGRVRNPYIAVWVEDTDGNYVSTLAVWYEQSGKGARWLSDLRAWMSSSDGQVPSTSTGATRSAGTYSLVWDGTDLDGNAVAQGDYVVWVEAAREHGPYGVTSATISITDGGATVTLPDDGELSALTATLTV
jgi:hypothetical protein